MNAAPHEDGNLDILGKLNILELIDLVINSQRYEIEKCGGRDGTIQQKVSPVLFGKKLTNRLASGTVQYKPYPAEVIVAMAAAAMIKTKNGSDKSAMKAAMQSYNQISSFFGGHIDQRLLPVTDTFRRDLKDGMYSVEIKTVSTTASGEEFRILTLRKKGPARRKDNAKVRVGVADTMYYKIAGALVDAKDLHVEQHGSTVKEPVARNDKLEMLAKKMLNDQSIGMTASITLLLNNNCGRKDVEPKKPVKEIIQGLNAMDGLKRAVENYFVPQPDDPLGVVRLKEEFQNNFTLPANLPLASAVPLIVPENVPSPASSVATMNTSSSSTTLMPWSTGTSNGQAFAHGPGAPNIYTPPYNGRPLLIGNVPGDGAGVSVDIMMVATNAYQAGQLATLKEEQKEKERKEKEALEERKKEEERKRMHELRVLKIKRVEDRKDSKQKAQETRMGNDQLLKGVLGAVTEGQKTLATTIQGGFDEIRGGFDKMEETVIAVTTGKKTPNPNSKTPEITPTKLFAESRDERVKAIIQERIDNKKNRDNTTVKKFEVWDELTMTEGGGKVPVLVVGTSKKRVFFVVRDDKINPEVVSKHPDKFEKP